MIQLLIDELIQYGIVHSLIVEADKIYIRNRLMELLRCQDYNIEKQADNPRPIHEILKDILDYALKENILKEDTSLLLNCRRKVTCS